MNSFQPMFPSDRKWPHSTSSALVSWRAWRSSPLCCGMALAVDEPSRRAASRHVVVVSSILFAEKTILAVEGQWRVLRCATFEDGDSEGEAEDDGVAVNCDCGMASAGWNCVCD